MTRQTERENHKPAWDTRTWLVGLGLGIPLSLCVELGDEFRGYGFIPWHDYVALKVSSGVLVIVLPGVLSGIARRKWLLWGYLPVWLDLFWAVVIVFVFQHQFPGKFYSAYRPMSIAALLVRLFVLPFFPSGIVCVFRQILVDYRASRDSARLAEQLRFEKANVAAKEPYVWPPPIQEPPANASEAETSIISKFT